MAGRQADVVVLGNDARTFLESQVRRHKAPRSLSDRCRMILLCAQGLQSKDVAERLGVHEHTVGKWRRRFVKDGIEGLTDEYRAGRPRTVSDAQVAEVVERTLNTTPKDATHWSIRSMAADSGLSHTTIRRIWTAFGLQPHRAETFKLSWPLNIKGAQIYGRRFTALHPSAALSQTIGGECWRDGELLHKSPLRLPASGRVAVAGERR